MLPRRRIHQRATVDSAQSGLIGELYDTCPCGLVIAEYKHVACNVLVGRQLVRRHIVKAGYHRHLFAQPRLPLGRRPPFGGPSHPHPPGRPPRTLGFPPPPPPPPS